MTSQHIMDESGVAVGMIVTADPRYPHVPTKTQGVISMLLEAAGLKDRELYFGAFEESFSAQLAALQGTARAYEEAFAQKWHGVFLDGRNEHGSHVLPLHERTMEGLSEDHLLDFAEAIIADAELVGYKVNHAAIANFNLTGEHSDEAYWEYVGINLAATKAIYGTPEFQEFLNLEAEKAPV